MKAEKKHLTIQELAGIVGVSTSALRAWERRYAIFTPERTQGGHRLYTQDDLKLFWFITHLRAQGNDLKQIANLGRDDLLTRASAFFDLTSTKNPNPAVEGVAHEKKKLPTPFLSILDALKTDNVEEAIAALEKVYALSESSLKFADSALDLMVEIGEHWHRGEITVAAEHALTSRVKHMLLGLFYINNAETSPQSSEAPLALCATLPHELHELGLLRVALYLKSWGFRVTYLGANTPIVDIEDYCQRRKPTMVVVSCASSLNLTSMVQSLKQLELRVSPLSPVVVGGSGINALNAENNNLTQVIFLRKMEELEIIAAELRKLIDAPPEQRLSALQKKLGN